MANLANIRAFCKWAASRNNPKLGEFHKWNASVKKALQTGKTKISIYTVGQYCYDSVDALVSRYLQWSGFDRSHFSLEDIELMAKNLLGSLSDSITRRKD